MYTYTGKLGIINIRTVFPDLRTWENIKTSTKYNKDNDISW